MIPRTVEEQVAYFVVALALSWGCVALIRLIHYAADYARVKTHSARLASAISLVESAAAGAVQDVEARFRSGMKGELDDGDMDKLRKIAVDSVRAQVPGAISTLSQLEHVGEEAIGAYLGGAVENAVSKMGT